MLKPGYRPEEEEEEEGYVWPAHTLSDAWTMIEEGEDAWVALGWFMHDFFGTYQSNRAALLQDPIIVNGPLPIEQWRWAVFCAGSAIYLAEKYQLPVPEWAKDPHYRLEDPWYHGLGSQEKLRVESPEPFRKRNIFCPRRIYANKYEREDLAERRVNSLSIYNPVPQNAESA